MLYQCEKSFSNFPDVLGLDSFRGVPFCSVHLFFVLYFVSILLPSSYHATPPPYDQRISFSLVPKEVHDNNQYLKFYLTVVA